MDALEAYSYVRMAMPGLKIKTPDGLEWIVGRGDVTKR